MNENKSNPVIETPSLAAPAIPRKGVPTALFLVVLALLLGSTWYGYKTKMRAEAREADLNQSQQDLAQLQSESQATIVGLTTEFTRAQQQIGALTEQQAKTEANLSATKESLAAARTQVDATQKQVAKLSGEIADLQTLKTAIEGDLAQTQQTVVAMQKQIDQVTKEKQQKETELAQAQETISTKEQQLASEAKADWCPGNGNRQPVQKTSGNLERTGFHEEDPGDDRGEALDNGAAKSRRRGHRSQDQRNARPHRAGTG